jgi:taurine dioxygenase
MTPGGNSNTSQHTSEEKLQIKSLSEHVGAEIRGVNLAADLADDTFEKIDDAYNHYSVLVFRDQTLTPAQQIAFARRFGELEISPRTQFALPGHPEILVLSNIIENGKPIGNAESRIRLQGPRNRTAHDHPRISDEQTNSDEMMLKISNIFG